MADGAGDRLGEGRGGGGEEGAGRDGGGAEFLRGGGGVAGGDARGEGVGGGGDAGLEGAGLAPGVVVRAAGWGGEVGADGLGEDGGLGGEGDGEGLSNGEVGESGGGFAWGQGRRSLQKYATRLAQLKAAVSHGLEGHAEVGCKEVLRNVEDYGRIVSTWSAAISSKSSELPPIATRRRIHSILTS